MSAADKPSASADHSQTIFHLQQAFKLALSMVLFYWLALWMNWDEPKYGGLAIVIISLGTTGASIEKGLMRIVGTTVGVAVGFLILGLFNHDRWDTLLAFTVYLAVMCYFMQTSRYPYAWYAAAFIPLVIWGDNYPNFDSAFYFGTFRYLNTTVGVLIYTMVDLVFWPRYAGDQLNPLGRDLWAEVREQFGNYRGVLEQGQRPTAVSQLRSNLAGTLSRSIATLQQAYLDTPAIGSQKRVWEAWRFNAHAIVDSLEIWRETIDDCRKLNLDRLMPQLGPGLDTLDHRLERIGALWEARSAADDAPDTDDGSLLDTLNLGVNHSAYADLTPFERAAFMSFFGQLKTLDGASHELLKTMEVLAGREPSQGLRVSPHVRDTFQPARWDPDRLLHALYPSAVFISAFVFWILMNPPTGPKVPMFAGLLSVMVLQTRANPVALLITMLLGLLVAVAPVYWLVMPALSSGFGLLSLIFIFSFVFGYLGGASPALKTGPMMMFVVATGISNQQSYSFQSMADMSLMLLLAGVILTVVHYLFHPMRPEQNLLRGLRRFFQGCARVAAEFAVVDPAYREKGRWKRKGYFQSLVLPAPAKIQAAQKNLDYELYLDNSPDKVQRLHDCVQSIAYRLQSIEIAHDRIARQSSEFPESLVPLRGRAWESVQLVFERWAAFEPDDAFEQQRGSLQDLSHDLQQQLDALESSGDGDSISDSLLTDLYTMLGSVKGLIEAMANAQSIINQINWAQWATPRF